MAGKCDSRHSTTSSRKNVVEAETSYQMLEVLSFCDRERTEPPSIKLTVLTFLEKTKYNEAFRGVSVLFEKVTEEKVKSRTRSHSRPRI